LEIVTIFKIAQYYNIGKRAVGYSSGREKKGLNVENKKILIIEDNPANLKLVTDILSVEGYDVIQANNGKAGLDALMISPKEIGLILLDIKLPDIDGFEVLKQIKNNEEVKNIPVIIVSAHAMEADVKKSLEAGCLDYITKPINIKKFLARIKSVV